jgi:UDP-N-acetyl-2-amino-2-deoxyglucuronate dehydrogenase
MISACERESTLTEAAQNTNVKPQMFALIGAAGYIAPKHMKAIRDTGNTLVAAIDPNDSVGVIDSYFPEARFFTEIERFDRFLEKCRRAPGDRPVDYVSICTPNYLHDAHVRLALRVKAHAICEKPLVINPWNLDQLRELEEEHQRRVYTVLQLRLHPVVRQLKQALGEETNRSRREVCLTYVTRRGSWYYSSWKGMEQRSGGLAMNIGIHFFDVLLWLFGTMQRSVVHHTSASMMSGFLELEWARVRWFLSVDEADLPEHVRQKRGHAWRSITIDGQELDLSEGFTDLHTEVYRDILQGGGFGITDATRSVELVHHIRSTTASVANGLAHPSLRQLHRAHN